MGELWQSASLGMDEAGLRQMSIPAYLIVGAGDTTTPPKDNAEFAAKYGWKNDPARAVGN